MRGWAIRALGSQEPSMRRIIVAFVLAEGRPGGLRERRGARETGRVGFEPKRDGPTGSLRKKERTRLRKRPLRSGAHEARVA